MKLCSICNATVINDDKTMCGGCAFDAAQEETARQEPTKPCLCLVCGACRDPFCECTGEAFCGGCNEPRYPYPARRISTTPKTDKETPMETKIVNGDRMTVLVPRYGEGPLECGTTVALGTYLWEKERTVSIARLTGEKRGTPEKPRFWKTTTREGVTVTGGRLRCWLKEGKNFFTLDADSLGWSWMSHTPEKAVEELCLRNGFRLAEGTTLRNRIMATNYPGAIKTFGLETVLMLSGLALHLVGDDGDMTRFFKHYRIAAEDQPLITSLIRSRHTTALKQAFYRQALGLPVSAEGYASQYHKGFSFSVGWTRSLPVSYREYFSHIDPDRIRAYGKNAAEITGAGESLPPLTDDVQGWLDNLTVRSVAVQIRLSLEKSKKAFVKERRAWQAEGLMPENGQGYLMWKCVHADGTGVLGYPYQVGVPFETVDGMATVGPWGAVREYGQEDLYVLALRVTKSGQVLDAKGKVRKGVMYAFEGMPVAQYRITEKTADGFTPLLMTGVDEMALLTEVPTRRDPRPFKPFLSEADNYRMEAPGRCDWCGNLTDMVFEGKYGTTRTYLCVHCGGEMDKGITVTWGDCQAEPNPDFDPFADSDE